MTRWEITHANWGRAQRLASEGWEPFAVAHSSKGYSAVYLRRPLQRDEEVADVIPLRRQWAGTAGRSPEHRQTATLR